MGNLELVLLGTVSMRFKNQKTLVAPFVSHVQIDSSDRAGKPRLSYMEVFAVGSSITHSFASDGLTLSYSFQDTSPISEILTK